MEVPDFVKVAQAFGLPAVRIVKNDELADKIQEVLNTPGPVVCELECAENYTFAPKLSARKLEDASMVSPSLEDMFPFLEREELAENMSISRKEK